MSTQQIMHPDKYLERIDPSLPEIPAIPDQKHFRKLAEGTLGEFDFRVLLTQYGSEKDADALDPSLEGSQFALFENKQEKYPVLTFSAKWATAEKARSFLAAYRRALEGKSKSFELGAGSSADKLTGHDDAGFFRVILKTNTVESIEGLKSSLN